MVLMRPKGIAVEVVLGRIAQRQHGVVTRRQLLSAGVTPGEIKGRLAKGLLIPEYRGVYRVGHRAPSLEAQYLAAVLACGNGALLSGGAAAHLYGLLKISPPPPPEVSVPAVRRVKGLKTRRSSGGHDATRWRGVPVTTVPRTLVDIAAVVPVDDLARACHEAGVRYGTTPSQVERVLARRWNSPGAANLRRVLRGETEVTMSKLERGFLSLLRDERLPLPQTNRPAGGRRVDCRWPERRLTVELDGYRYHHSRHAWEQDRRREREARALGDEFRRYTFGDVFEDPGLMLAELRQLLHADSGKPSSALTGKP